MKITIAVMLRLMNLRTKWIAIFVALVGLFFVFVYFVAAPVFLKGFERVESGQMEQNVARGEDMLNYTSEQLDIKLGDWSHWDDTYNFVNNKMPGYEANIEPGPLASLQLNYVLFFDNKGKLHTSRAINENAELVQVPQGLLDVLKPDSPILQHESVESSRKGILNLPDGILMFASQPITHTDRSGSVSGTMIFAQYLNENKQRELANLTKLDLHYYPVNGQIPNEVADIKPLLSVEKPVVKATSDSQIGGYKLYADAIGNPSVIVMVHSPRTVLAEGKSSVRTLLFVMQGVGVLAVIAVIVMLDKLLFRRVIKLSSEVMSIGKAGGGVRLVPDKKDEVGKLRIAINDMLEEIEHAQELKKSNVQLALTAKQATDALDKERSSLEQKVQERTAELQKLKETLEQQVVERTNELHAKLDEAQRMNEVMIGRELRMSELKDEIAHLKEQLK